MPLNLVKYTQFFKQSFCGLTAGKKSIYARVVELVDTHV